LGAGCPTRNFSASGKSKKARASTRVSSTISPGMPWPEMIRKPMSRQARSTAAATARLPASPPVQYGAISTIGTDSNVIFDLSLSR
jgi:hypothetical protein